jgi:hypothetical protein
VIDEEGHPKAPMAEELVSEAEPAKAKDAQPAKTKTASGVKAATAAKAPKGRKPPKGETSAKAKARTKKKKPFPSVPFERALQVPIQIKEKNGGNPWTPADIAAAIGSSPKSSEFFYVTAAARDFGMTTGTRDTATIELTDLGREIVYAPNPEVEAQKKREAFNNVELFAKVLKHYKGSDLPEMKYLGNTLYREFGLDPEYDDEFSTVFRENCKFLGIQSGDVAAATTDRPSTVILGVPSKKTSLKAFVIMPFVEKTVERAPGFFAEVLSSLIIPAALDAGFVVETANRQRSDLIQSTIINELLDADLVVADLTDHNPNVLFELGLRIANQTPVALIKAAGTGRLFDVDNMLRVFEYKPQLWRSTLEVDRPALAKHLQGAWENRTNEQTYMKILRKGAA